MEYFLLWMIISKKYLTTIQESYGYNFLTNYFVGPQGGL